MEVWVRKMILKNCGTCVLIPFLPQVSVDWAAGSGVLMKPDWKLLSWKCSYQDYTDYIMYRLNWWETVPSITNKKHRKVPSKNQNSLFHKCEVRFFPKSRTTWSTKTPLYSGCYSNARVPQALTRLWQGSMIIVLSGGKVKKPVLNASP